MTREWLRVLAQLEDEHRRFADELLPVPSIVPSGLQQAASEDQIRATEARLGVQLSADMKDFYRLTNGYNQANGWSLLPLEQLGSLRALYPGLAAELSSDSSEDALRRRRRRRRAKSRQISLNDIDVGDGFALSSFTDTLWLWDPLSTHLNPQPFYQVVVRDWTAVTHESLLAAIESDVAGFGS